MPLQTLRRVLHSLLALARSLLQSSSSTTPLPTLSLHLFHIRYMASLEVGRQCTCNHSFNGAPRTCAACRRLTDTGIIHGDETLAPPFLPRLLAGFISGALTGVFAIAGAFTGAVTGALAGRVSDSGIIRAAGLGAVAGAVLSIEVLETSLFYWCTEQTSDSGISMTDFIDEVLHARIIREHFNPTMFSFQLSIPVLEMEDENMYDMFGEMSLEGLSNESLKKLPYHEVTNERRSIHGEDLCCTICLQDIVQGETVRSLPLCSHTFHLPCIDRWLGANGTCPVCRQYV